MGWWGKVIGGTVGFAIGGPLGALIGGALGHNVDRELASRALPGERASQRERIQTAFFTATFSVMGRLAKADGRVTEAEISAANRVMDHLGLTEDMRQTARRLFGEGKSETFPLEQVIEQFAHECGHRRELARMFIEIQVMAAAADGAIQPAERTILERICTRLGIRAAELEQIESIVTGTYAGPSQSRTRAADPLRSAYAVLGVEPGSSDEQVTRAYRKLMSQHHPDKLVAQGLPDEMMEMATRRTQEIKAAYDRVRESRGR